MASSVQHRRGTTAQNNAFTGLIGEFTMDTTKKTLVVHDGATAGGSPLQKELVSGTNIKTINGTSVLGSGNITVSGSSAWVTKTANYTAVDKDRILADTTSSAFTITLPATPTAGQEVTISDAGGTFSTNNLTIGRNGSNILGLAQDLVLDVSNDSVNLVYYNGTRGWVLTK